jgi:hypothetical protein
MACTPEKCAKLEADLADALAALHKINTGGSARVVVDQNGERVEFTAVNLNGLRSYINSLNAQLVACGCPGHSLPTPSGPAMFIF